MFGGYSQSITINEKFVLRISHPADQLAPVPPLLRTGMITYSPLAGPGKKVGIVGIGGLGHMGMKLAHAMGAHVVALTTSENKRQDALDLGARHRKAYGRILKSDVKYRFGIDNALLAGS